MAKGDLAVIDTQIYETDEGNGYYASVVPGIGDIYLAFSTGDGTDGYVYSVTIDSAGNISAPISSLEWHPNISTTIYISAAQVSEGVVIAVCQWRYTDIYALRDGVAATISVDEAGNLALTHTNVFAPHTGLIDQGGFYTPDILKVSSGVFAVVARWTEGDDGWLWTLGVDGAGTISVIDSVAYTVSSAVNYPQIIHFVDDIYVITHGSSTSATIITVEIASDGTITSEGAIDIENVDSSDIGGIAFPRITKISDTVVAIACTVGARGGIITHSIDAAGIINGYRIDYYTFTADDDPDNAGRVNIFNSGVTDADVFVVVYHVLTDPYPMYGMSLSISSDGVITKPYLNRIALDSNATQFRHQKPISVVAYAGNARGISVLSYIKSNTCKLLTYSVDTDIPVLWVCGGAGINNFTAQMLGDATGTLLQWDVGRACPTCSDSTAGDCKITIQYSTDGTPHQTPNTPPYVVRDLVQPQCIQRALWHPNTSHVNYYYSAWIYYEVTNQWLGPFNPAITPTLPAVLGSIEPFASGSLSFTKLGTNTKLSTRQDIIADIIVWLPESQSEREPSIEAAMQAVAPAHTKLNVMYEQYYIAQTTTEQFSIADYDATVHTIRNGMIVNRKATIDSSYDGLATILGD